MYENMINPHLIYYLGKHEFMVSRSIKAVRFRVIGAHKICALYLLLRALLTICHHIMVPCVILLLPSAIKCDVLGWF